MSTLPELLHFCSSVLTPSTWREPPERGVARRHPPLLVGCAQHRLEDRSSSREAFIPQQIENYAVGIPTCLAKQKLYHLVPQSGKI